MATAAREPVILDADVIPEPRTTTVEAPFVPVIFRNITRPNLKIMRSLKERILDGPNQGKWRVTPLEPYAFVNSYFRADTKDKYDTVVARAHGELYVEPGDGEAAGPPLRYINARGEVELTTRVPELFEAYQRKVTTS